MEITEKKLIIVSAVLVVAGLATLWAAISFFEKHPLTYNEFVREPEVRVVLSGNVTAVRTTQSMTFVEITTTCTLPGVSFTVSDFPLGPATIIGTKKYYEGIPEIIIEDVTYEALP